MEKRKIVHIFGGNPVGGINTLLSGVIQHSGKHFHHTVLGLSWKGRMETAGVDAAGAHMRHLDLKFDEASHAADLLTLASAIGNAQPDIIHTWGRNGNYLGTVAVNALRRMQGKAASAPLVWNLTSNRDQAKTPEPYLAKVLQETVALSHVPDRIVCVSDSVRDVHAAMGCSTHRMDVHYNGIDTDKFSPEHAAAGAQLRAALGIPAGASVVGMAARFDPNKDQEGFLMAAGALSRRMPDAHFILCGTGNTKDNPTLKHWALQNGLNGKLHALGQRGDMPQLYHAADLWAVCSRSEAFPNAPMEAMASGKPVTCTEAGGAQKVIDDPGLILPVRGDGMDNATWAARLARAWDGQLSAGPEEQKARAARLRGKITSEFDIRGTAAFYDRIADALAPAQQMQPARLQLAV